MVRYSGDLTLIYQAPAAVRELSPQQREALARALLDRIAADEKMANSPGVLGIAQEARRQSLAASRSADE